MTRLIIFVIKLKSFMLNNKAAILICTHDGYKSLWKPLEESYNKFWHECSLNIYLTTNYEFYNGKRFISLVIGDEISWSDNIIKSLNKINEDWIFLTFDDVFWKCKIDNMKIEKLFKRCIDEDWDYLRLHNSPPGEIKIDKEISLISKSAQYRTSTALALFKKKTLLKLLDENESAWDFEKKGSLRSSYFPNFYVVNKITLPYYNLIVKGKVDMISFLMIKMQKINLDFVKLKRMNLMESILRFAYVLIYKVYVYFNFVVKKINGKNLFRG